MKTFRGSLAHQCKSEYVFVQNKEPQSSSSWHFKISHIWYNDFTALQLNNEIYCIWIPYWFIHRNNMWCWPCACMLIPTININTLNQKQVLGLTYWTELEGSNSSISTWYRALLYNMCVHNQAFCQNAMMVLISGVQLFTTHSHVIRPNNLLCEWRFRQHYCHCILDWWNSIRRWDSNRVNRTWWHSYRWDHTYMSASPSESYTV